ncbi:hydroxyacylglutathione hydrolase [Oceanicoccus sagamiensis]|uniref:Hydroxyacylglutathione hydrolase n=1 Tax=Oceanicoccus sagamiensis TaxID=716816 RepID=A0A1X9NJ37_9GAMM|nr:hydroxyacylglutathione hydrolase [Oceanicoccus sagamiensis]ARN75855.1 hydroxyacylglutathione hydrolase [Oceanicoccus sagamiensis]
MILVKPIPAFDDNYIWCLYDDVSHQAAVVDPGDAKVVIAALEAMNLELAALLITHHHFDHTGGINTLLALGDIPVYGPHSENIPQITQRLSHGETLSLLGLEFTTLEIPGHTLDHIALYSEQAEGGPILFCGDTLFAGGCGRVFEGNPGMMLASLNKLAALPANTRVYCAHEYTLANLAFAKAVEPGNPALLARITSDSQLRQQNRPTLPSTVAMELATNPFLRCDQPEVAASAAQQSEQACTDTTAVFAAIRGWKDNF